MYKIQQDRLLPKSKAVLRKQNDRVCQGHRAGKSSQWPEQEQLEQQNNVELDYDPKYEMNIHEFHFDINKCSNELKGEEKQIPMQKNSK